MKHSAKVEHVGTDEKVAETKGGGIEGVCDNPVPSTDGPSVPQPGWDMLRWTVSLSESDSH